jgi:hypothetical protein
VCAAQGNIVSADPSRTDDVVDLPPTYKGWLSFEEKHRLFFVRQRIQFEAFETMGWCIDERLEDLVDRPITDVSMGELHRLDEEDLRSFCRIKCIPVTVDKLELRRHVIGASRAYLHISSRLPFTSTSMKLLIHKYSAAIEQCYIDVANRDESTLPLVDPQTPPPSHHPTPSLFLRKFLRYNFLRWNFKWRRGHNYYLEADQHWKRRRGELHNNIMRGMVT